MPVSLKIIPYIVLEFIDGKNIIEYCLANKLSLEKRLKLFIEVAKALEYAHEHSIIHKDIKPSNILVDEKGIPHLIDFGIAKSARNSNEKSKVHAYTVKYASPELVRRDVVTLRSDIFQLGHILNEILTNTHPFDNCINPIILSSFKDESTWPNSAP